ERDPAQADDRFALDHRRSIGPQSLAKGNQRGLQLPAQHGAHAESAEQRLIHGGVEPEDAEVGLWREQFDARQSLHRDPGGGMHAHIKSRQVRILEDFGIELLQRKIEAGHRKALALEQRGRLRQGKRLPPQLIEVYEDDLEGASRSSRRKWCNLGQHGSAILISAAARKALGPARGSPRPLRGARGIAATAYRGSCPASTGSPRNRCPCCARRRMSAALRSCRSVRASRYPRRPCRPAAPPGRVRGRALRRKANTRAAVRSSTRTGCRPRTRVPSAATSGAV